MDAHKPDGIAKMRHRKVKFVGGAEIQVRWWNKYGRKKVRDVELGPGAEVILRDNQVIFLEYRCPSLFNEAGQRPAPIPNPQRREA